MFPILFAALAAAARGERAPLTAVETRRLAALDRFTWGAR